MLFAKTFYPFHLVYLKIIQSSIFKGSCVFRRTTRFRSFVIASKEERSIFTRSRFFLI